jgi:hypothetical protein
MVLMALMSGVRLIRRLYGELQVGAAARSVVICGAGDLGAMIARQMHRDYAFRVTAFVDEDPTLTGQRIHGVPVKGTITDLPAIVGACSPDHVVIAIPDQSEGKQQTIRELLRHSATEVVPFNRLQELLGASSDRHANAMVSGQPSASLGAEPVGGVASQRCPRCHGVAHRSRARSIIHVLRKRFSAKRLYRCVSCRWRGWMLPLEMPAATSIATDVSAWEPFALEDLADVGAQAKPAFSPHDLR